MLSSLSTEIRNSDNSNETTWFLQINTVNSHCYSANARWQSALAVCNTNSITLGLLAAAIGDYSGKTALLEETPNYCISAMQRSAKADSHSPGTTSFKLYREMKYSVIHSHQVMVFRHSKRSSYFQNSLHEHDHGVLLYDTQKMALIMAIEIILDGLAKNAAFLLVRSSTQIEQTLQMLSTMGIDTAGLLSSRRLNPVPNDSYTAVTLFLPFTHS